MFDFLGIYRKNVWACVGIIFLIAGMACSLIGTICTASHVFDLFGNLDGLGYQLWDQFDALSQWLYVAAMWSGLMMFACGPQTRVRARN